MRRYRGKNDPELGKTAETLNSPPAKPRMLKARLPKFLTPRRRYEVNESMLVVKIGRSQLVPRLRPAWKVLLEVARGSAVVGGHAWVVVDHQLHSVVLIAQWRRMPKSWELSFVSKMKSAESQGIPFPQVLQTNLPLVLGDAPSEVLLRWVGRKARSQPKHFAKVVAKMFGPSGKRIITSLDERCSLQDMLVVHEEPEEPFQALIESIERADVAKSGPPRYLDKNRWKNFSA